MIWENRCEQWCQPYEQSNRMTANLFFFSFFRCWFHAPDYCRILYKYIQYREGSVLASVTFLHIVNFFNGYDVTLDYRKELVPARIGLLKSGTQQQSRTIEKDWVSWVKSVRVLDTLRFIYISFSLFFSRGEKTFSHLTSFVAKFIRNALILWI